MLLKVIKHKCLKYISGLGKNALSSIMKLTCYNIISVTTILIHVVNNILCYSEKSG